MCKKNQCLKIISWFFLHFLIFFTCLIFFYTFLDFFYNFFCENDFTRKNCKKNQRLKKNSSYCFFLHTEFLKTRWVTSRVSAARKTEKRKQDSKKRNKTTKIPPPTHFLSTEDLALQLSQLHASSVNNTNLNTTL